MKNNRIASFIAVMAVLVLAAVVSVLFAPWPLPVASSQEDTHEHDDEAEHHETHDVNEQPPADEHAHEDALHLNEEQLDELNIAIDEAGPSQLGIHVSLPGEVRLNEERLAHVVPKLAGIVRDVTVSLGDHVRQGEVMAVLESRELAAAKSAYMAAKEREGLAAAVYNREKELWEDEISAEQEFLEAQNTLAEARIEVRAAAQELHALGLTQEDLNVVAGQSSASWTRYRVTAPFEGTVIARHITLGEYVEVNADIFTVADLSSVWVDLNVYQKDLASVREGQEVVIEAQAALPEVTGTVDYVGPLVGEETRTALARVVLPNPEGLWKPGMFVTARATVEQQHADIAVPKTALITIEDRPHVFIQHDGEFEPVPVELGRADEATVEVLAGLEAGQPYVSQGGFHLKAELDKEAFAHSGHAH